MKQYEAVIEAMKANNGYATLGYLYREVLKISNVVWNTKTPFASIRRIVQDKRFFTKVVPGLYYLNEYRNKLPLPLSEIKRLSRKEKIEFDHSYYQGLIIEIGNFKKYETYIPLQDKNRKFLGRDLGQIASVKEFYRFTYDHLIRTAQTIDIVWFNQRKMPDSFFEVAHTTDIRNSLLKFLELQDFYVKYFIVADNTRKEDFYSKLSYDTFYNISKRIKFLSYEQVSNWHAKTFELTRVENDILR